MYWTATMNDAQNAAANDLGIIRIEGIESVRIPVVPHLETAIRCKRAAPIVHGDDGSLEIVIRNAVIRIEGDPDTEPGQCSRQSCRSTGLASTVLAIAAEEAAKVYGRAAKSARTRTEYARDWVPSAAWCAERGVASLTSAALTGFENGRHSR